MNIKIVQAGFETYTGDIFKYAFVGGVSVTDIPQIDIDRLSTAFQIVEIVDGEDVPAGIASRMVTNASLRAEVVKPLQRQTEEEFAQESLAKTIETLRKMVAPKIYTFEELSSIADTDGINGIRSIGDALNVKDRTITVLMHKIVDAQLNLVAEWEAKRAVLMEQSGLTEQDLILTEPEPMQEPGPQPEPISSLASEVMPAQTDINEAAVTGNLAAALKEGE